MLIASADRNSSAAEGGQDVAQSPRRGTASELQAGLSSFQLPVQQSAVLRTTECGMHLLYTHLYAHKLRLKWSSLHPHYQNMTDDENNKKPDLLCFISFTFFFLLDLVEQLKFTTPKIYDFSFSIASSTWFYERSQNCKKISCFYNKLHTRYSVSINYYSLFRVWQTKSYGGSVITAGYCKALGILRGPDAAVKLHCNAARPF